MNLVFVHLGNKIPKYLLFNIEATVKLVSHIKIWLITDKEENVRGLPSQVEIFFYRRTPHINELAKQLKHPKDFRNDFWFLSIERFFALESFLSINDGPTIHLESDVIISKDFPFEIFRENFRKITYPIVSQKRGIASCIYIPNHKELKIFTNFASKAIITENYTSDMLIMGDYFSEHFNRINVIPTGIHYFGHFNKNIPSKLLLKIESSLNKMHGIIDGHDIGVNYFGTDPRNSRGKRFFFKGIDESYIDFKKLKIVFNFERRFLDCISTDQQKKVPIYAIHATSKSLLLFYRFTRSLKLYFAVKSSVQFKVRFSFRIFLQSAFYKIYKKYMNLL